MITMFRLPFAVILLLLVLMPSVGADEINVPLDRDSASPVITSVAPHAPRPVLLWLDTLLVDQEPQFPAIPTVPAFAPRLKTLWLEALARPEADLRRQAADAIARAYEAGMEGLDDCVPGLIEALEDQEAHPVVRRAAARALIVLDARRAASILRKHAEANFDLAQLIEPALARWDDQPMRSVWLSRLEQQGGGAGRLILAIHAVAETGHSEAAPHLRALMFDPTVPVNIRLEASDALGRISADGLAADAGRLIADTSDTALVKRLMASRLLKQQSGPEAEALLTTLANDSEPAVAAAAMRRLFEIDPKLAAPSVATAKASRDAQLRLLAVETLRELPTPEGVGHLRGMLADAHPEVRMRAQESLIELDGAADLGSEVRDAAVQMLASDAPHGVAHAAVVLGAVGHKPAADRLVALLDHEEPEIFIASAWALRRLAVPETAEAIYKKLRRETEDSIVPRPLGTNVDWIWHMYQQHEHLIEALGVLRYREADSLLWMFFTKPPPPPIPPPDIRIDSIWRPELRSRALWALGQIHAEQPPKELVDRLTELLNDSRDSETVRAMAAVALGRMTAGNGTEDVLRQFYQPEAPYSVLGYASHWALQRITGESLPPVRIQPRTVWQTGWFLEPLEDSINRELESY